MNYTEEDREDKRYKKGYGKKEFKQDVQEAVKPLMKKRKTGGKMKANLAEAMPAKKAKYPTKRSEYAKMSAAELRKLLSEKKKKLLIKSGFPDGSLPRGKEAMISLCMKLKRKRW